MNLLSIAIDGPAGSGKSTVAKQIAERLNITYLDTGAMYRMVTLNLLNENINFDDLDKIKNILDKIDIKFADNALYLNNIDVTNEIRSTKITNAVSKVAAIQIVREKMVLMQREIAKGQSIIMDGRDIGTKVLKNATHKFFITASVEERSKRRMKDFKEQNIEISFEDLLDDIIKRDEADTNREISPLKQADDAILVDTTNMSMEQVVDFIISAIGV